MEVIKNQDSQAYTMLSTLWNDYVMANEEDLKEKLETIAETLDNYIAEMGSYIAPNYPALEPRS